MSVFDEFLVWFNFNPQGVLTAHSGPITWEEGQEYIKAFKCGHLSATGPCSGYLRWYADDRHSSVNARRIAEEFIADRGDRFPLARMAIQRKLDLDAENNRHLSA